MIKTIMAFQETKQPKDKMLLTSMIIILLFFSLMGMEIAWAIGLAGFGYLTLSIFR